jgi:hypothetical protein
MKGSSRRRYRPPAARHCPRQETRPQFLRWSRPRNGSQPFGSTEPASTGQDRDEKEAPLRAPSPSFARLGRTPVGRPGRHRGDEGDQRSGIFATVAAREAPMPCGSL